MMMCIILTLPLDAKFRRNYWRRIIGAVNNPWEKFKTPFWEKVPGAILVEASKEAPSVYIITSPLLYRMIVKRNQVISVASLGLT